VRVQTIDETAEMLRETGVLRVAPSGGGGGGRGGGRRCWLEGDIVCRISDTVPVGVPGGVALYAS
jgi:hypothetical protein